MTLDELRRHLDELDRRLLQTIADRQATSREIARVKRATGYPTRDYARERDVIVGARSNAESIGVSPDVAETVIRLLIRSSLTTQEQASVVAHGSGSGRRALVIGGAGKMGGWFTSFLTSQGFDVEVADPKAVAPGVKAIADWRESDLSHDFIVVAAPLGATNTILQELAQLKPRTQQARLDGGNAQPQRLRRFLSRKSFHIPQHKHDAKPLWQSLNGLA